MDIDDSGDSDEDQDFGLSPEVSSRPTKRRKLVRSSDDEISSGAEEELCDSARSDDYGKAREQNATEDGEESTKPKSKYKIHIPKNSELPSDAFFTQPPARSSSPYRIDHFHWKKPKRSPPPLEKPFSKPLSSRNVNSSTIPPAPRTKPLENPPPNLPQRTDLLEEEFALDDSYEDLLADLPSDAFSSPMDHGKKPSAQTILISSQPGDYSEMQQIQRLAAPLANLRQTTLFGTQAPEVNTQTQTTRKHNWPLANREEPPTHHKLDQDAMKTWVYPTNLGTIRDYQYSIVAKGLYHNMLVALPTGLGKTFIAATIMLNWYRWTTDAQIVFVAPTKPLVSQQVKACFDIVGIPRSATTMLTGDISPGLRAEEWRSKRVFFMTPQTIVNDLKTGICDPKKLVLLVVDEAHRATGGYAYVEVVKFLKRFNTSFRVLALTATPGASIEGVQEVIDGLGISRVEIRTEESIDIRQYVHSRKIDTILFENSDEMVMIMDLFSRALQPVLSKLTAMNAYWTRDPMMLTPFGCNQARVKWMTSDAGRKADFGIKGMVNAIFSLLASLAHGIELLKFHGIGPFYHKVLAFRNDILANGKKGGKYAKQINESEPFQTMMSRVQIWINNPDFMGHPKLEYLQSVVMNHFLDAGEGRGSSDHASTKVMVFAHYRDSAEEISRVLRRNDPMVRPHVFVGQANSKGSEGMDQKKQLEVIKNFQSGIYNTLVATSIGEEGLDIGEVDLIICYDASASPIRMLQRMGRTGRKRAGNIVVTLMKGKEENDFIKAKDNYEKMQQEIANGSRFNFHDEESRRIVPRDVQPAVDKRIIEIPPENTQPDLPEPSKRGRAPKRPPKKFHMPDGVRTGFVKASRLSDGEDNGQRPLGNREPRTRTARTDSPEPIPSLDDVLLTASEEISFERKYLDIQGDNSQTVEAPRNDTFPHLQRSLRPIQNLQHGVVTRRFVGMLQRMHHLTDRVDTIHKNRLSSQDRTAGTAQAAKRAAFLHQPAGRIGFSQDPEHDSLMGKHLSPSHSSRHPDRVYREAVATIEVSSDDDTEERDLSDLVHHNSEDDINIVSSSTLPPPFTTSFNPSRIQSPDIDADSGDDLPDFRTLVQNAGATTVTKASRNSVEQGGEKQSSRQGHRRRIIEDGSDE